MVAELRWALGFPAPAEFLNENALKGMHWAKTKKLRDAWKQATMAELILKGAHARNQPPSILEFTLAFKDNRVRDPHNYQPTIKPVVDQMIHMQMWPDDDPRYLSIPEPLLVVRKIPGIWIRCSTREEPI